MDIRKLSEVGSLSRAVDVKTEAELSSVRSIIAQVKQEGDEALIRLTEMYDHVWLDELKVTEAEIAEAYDTIESGVVTLIKEAAENIRYFHEQQKRASWFTTKEDGTLLGQKIIPLEAVGVYVPGGTAAYPSSVLMGIIPAKIAGVRRIVLTTPPGLDGRIPASVLVAAKESGAAAIYKIGGAQAIAALAYGTETIDPVDKIVGPGNIYVALAKREVFGTASIDAFAGPSEIAILADDSANPEYIAADLLSQAEHDPRAAAILVSTSASLAERALGAVKQQLADLPRKAIAEKALQNYGGIYVADSLSDAVRAINQFAPEHLEILTKNPMEVMTAINHAGAIFLGPMSPEPIGDYFAGTNHILPTSGTARFSSGLSVDDFVKKASVTAYSRAALLKNGRKVAAFARLEGLEAHARAVERRLGGEGDDEAQLYRQSTNA